MDGCKPHLFKALQVPMDELSYYSERPWSFCFRYITKRSKAHIFILTAVVTAVGFAVSTQYGVKALVDALTASDARRAWVALAILAALIAGDNLMWRVASYVGSFTFVAVTGDVRRDLFRHLTGHAPAFFSNRQSGTVASRITATSNAFFTIENMFVWNVLPPCVAAFGAILFIGSVSLMMASVLSGIFLCVIILMFRIASAGKPLHHDFAEKAARVDGDVIDTISNISLVKSFCGLPQETMRFGTTIDLEMCARRRSLLYLEKLRLIHALITIAVTLGLLIWAVDLWQEGRASAGQVVLVSTLGLSILHATRDLAVALVDVTQHTARLSEALSTLLLPHHLGDHKEAEVLKTHGASVSFKGVSFSYADGQSIFNNFDFHVKAGEWIGLIGESGAGKSTLFTLLQRFYDVDEGHIFIDGQDISRVTQDSLRQTMTVVPQDVHLFHRTLRENIRYGRPEASEQEIRRAAQAAQCMEFIDAMPEGMDTMVGDRGIKLSGGQRQRIAIARAILKNAPIVLLDEATSALDSKSESEVREALANLMRGRTVIAIAHRMSTLQGFDRIVKLENGKLSEAPCESLMPEAASQLGPLAPERVQRSVVRSYARTRVKDRLRLS